MNSSSRRVQKTSLDMKPCVRPSETPRRWSSLDNTQKMKVASNLSLLGTLNTLSHSVAKRTVRYSQADSQRQGYFLDLG